LGRRKSDEDYRRWREESPERETYLDRSLKRSREEESATSRQTSNNKRPKIDLTPEKFPEQREEKIPVPEKPSVPEIIPKPDYVTDEVQDDVTFTVTLSSSLLKEVEKQEKVVITEDEGDSAEIAGDSTENRADSADIEGDSAEDNGSTAEGGNHSVQLRKQGRSVPNVSNFVRAPRAPNGRFKNMSLVIEKPKSQKSPVKTTAKTTTTKVPIREIKKEKGKTPPKNIPPKRLPKTTTKKIFKTPGEPTPVTFMASKLSLDNELPDITVSRSGNMVWRPTDIIFAKQEKLL